MHGSERDYMVRQTIEDVGLEIERAMRATCMTTRELAERSGIDALVLDDVIHGRADCDLDTLAAIAHAMKMRWRVSPPVRMQPTSA